MLSSFTQSKEEGEEGGCGADCKKTKSLDFIVSLVCRAKAEARKSWPGHAALCKHADLCQDTWACRAQAHLCLSVLRKYFLILGLESPCWLNTVLVWLCVFLGSRDLKWFSVA